MLREEIGIGWVVTKKLHAAFWKRVGMRFLEKRHELDECMMM